MILKKKLVIISISVAALAVLVIAVAAAPGFWVSFFSKPLGPNNNYLVDYAKLPITVTATTRLEQKDNEVLAYLDIQVTNNSKETISAIQYFLISTVYTKDAEGNEKVLASFPPSTSTKLMWDGLKFIGSGKSVTLSVPIEEINNGRLANNIQITKIECDLYINWIRYTSSSQWGSHSIFLLPYYSTIIDNAPKIDVPTCIAA